MAASFPEAETEDQNNMSPETSWACSRVVRRERRVQYRVPAHTVWIGWRRGCIVHHRSSAWVLSRGERAHVVFTFAAIAFFRGRAHRASTGGAPHREVPYHGASPARGSREHPFGIGSRRGRAMRQRHVKSASHQEPLDWWVWHGCSMQPGSQGHSQAPKWTEDAAARAGGVPASPTVGGRVRAAGNRLVAQESRDRGPSKRQKRRETMLRGGGGAGERASECKGPPRAGEPTFESRAPNSVLASPCLPPPCHGLAHEMHRRAGASSTPGAVYDALSTTLASPHLTGRLDRHFGRSGPRFLPGSSLLRDHDAGTSTRHRRPEALRAFSQGVSIRSSRLPWAHSAAQLADYSTSTAVLKDAELLCRGASPAIKGRYSQRAKHIDVRACVARVADLRGPRTKFRQRAPAAQERQPGIRVAVRQSNLDCANGLDPGSCMEPRERAGSAHKRDGDGDGDGVECREGANSANSDFATSAHRRAAHRILTTRAGREGTGRAGTTASSQVRNPDCASRLVEGSGAHGSRLRVVCARRARANALGNASPFSRESVNLTPDALAQLWAVQRAIQASGGGQRVRPLRAPLDSVFPERPDTSSVDL
ncbi:hypothetical protein VTO73DRAFT_6701 [Trametes versicolor]